MPFDGNLPEVTTTLIAARQYIEENGWCRTFRRGKRACIIGALYTVTLDNYAPKEGDEMPKNEKVNKACEVISKTISMSQPAISPSARVIHWNDATVTTHKKVLELLDKAIERSMKD